ncbi:MAG TPA: putative Ig domain-containing protein, partial [Candidatus Binatia bacterium]|nr:putative Ig domain-containing protein [Candidatus Binatia bacterium]
NAFTTRLATVSVPANDNYGQPVAATRDTVVVGAPFDKNAGGQSIGSAYVFVVRSNNFSQWDLVKIIQAPIPLSGDQFGFSVAIDRDTIVVGAPVDVANGIASGTAYVFTRNQGGSNQWGFVKKLVANDAAAADQFGNAVAVSGDTIAVGAHLRDDAGNNAGGVYLFERNLTGPNQWGQSHKTIDPQGRGGDEFGYAVSLSGDILAVGAPFDDDLGSSSGTISIFERNYNPTNPITPLPNNWGLRKHLVASDGAANDEFGFVVSVNGTVVVVGAPFATVVASASGAAYAFARDAGGSNNWGQVKKIVPPDGAGSDQFGSAVGFDGDTAVIGAKLDDDRGQNTGSAYVFRRNFNPAAPAVPAPENWGLIEKFLPLLGGTNSHFGFSVAIQANTVVVGSSFEASGQVPDATYIFRLKFNNSPVFAQPVPDLVVTAGSLFTNTIPLNLLGDSDVGEVLMFSAILTDGSALPGWLSFDPLTRTFRGSPGPSDIGSLAIRVTVTDQDFGTGSDVFQITVNPLNPAPSLVADYDGQANLYEYAFATNPSSVSDPILTIYGDKASGNVYLVYRCRNNDPRLTYGLEVTTNFLEWTAADFLVDPVRTVPLSEEFANVVLLLKEAPLPVAQAFFRITVHFSR